MKPDDHVLHNHHLDFTQSSSYSYPILASNNQKWKSHILAVFLLSADRTLVFLTSLKAVYHLSHQKRVPISKLDADLTGIEATLTADTVAGTTHTWPIKTAYYTANIPIWLDEITEPQTWSAEFLAPQAREVLTVLGAFVVCFQRPIDENALKEVRALLENVAEVVKEGCGYSWDGVCLAVAMPQSTTPYLEKSFDEWEEFCQEFGFEYVDFEDKGRNEYAGKF
jgi:hypothetical protein